MTKDDWVEICSKCLEDHGTKNFSALEICDVGRRSGDVVLSAPPVELLENAYNLIDVLEWLRAKDGVASVLVNSWYRDPEYNAAIGGVSHSMHLTLGAADIVKVGRSPSEVADMLEGHPHSKLFGIGRYKSFTHVDIRGMINRPSPARWGSNE
tara:strand:- start:1936 stop:2394 length:459 start_codon:yes stop_codon:yes gene_type:complete